MCTDYEGFDCATRVPESEEAVRMVGGNYAEFVDAIGMDQFLEILNGLATLKLTDAGPELLPGIFL